MMKARLVCIYLPYLVIHSTIERKFSGLALGTGSILTIKLTHQTYQYFLWLKFRYSGKATQIWSIFQISLKIGRNDVFIRSFQFLLTFSKDGPKSYGLLRLIYNLILIDSNSCRSNPKNRNSLTLTTNR